MFLSRDEKIFKPYAAYAQLGTQKGGGLAKIPRVEADAIRKKRALSMQDSRQYRAEAELRGLRRGLARS